MPAVQAGAPGRRAAAPAGPQPLGHPQRGGRPALCFPNNQHRPSRRVTGAEAGGREGLRPRVLDWVLAGLARSAVATEDDRNLAAVIWGGGVPCQWPKHARRRHGRRACRAGPGSVAALSAKCADKQEGQQDMCTDRRVGRHTCRCWAAVPAKCNSTQACQAGAGRTSSQLVGWISPCSGARRQALRARPHSCEHTNWDANAAGMALPSSPLPELRCAVTVPSPSVALRPQHVDHGPAGSRQGHARRCLWSAFNPPAGRGEQGQRPACCVSGCHARGLAPARWCVPACRSTLADLASQVQRAATQSQHMQLCFLHQQSMLSSTTMPGRAVAGEVAERRCSATSSVDEKAHVSTLGAPAPSGARIALARAF